MVWPKLPPRVAVAVLLGNPIFMILAMFAIMYFLVLRPQSKKAKEHQKMLAELKKGDDVVTQGGHHRQDQPASRTPS